MDSFEERLYKRNGENRVFLFRLCGAKDLEDLFRLENAVYRGIEDKRLYGTPESREGLARLLAREWILGVFWKDKLVGAAILVRDPKDPCHLYGSLQKKEGLPFPLCTYNAVFLQEDVRGFGLQSRLIGLMDAIAQKEGMRAALASVSPYNPQSRNNLFAAGFAFMENCRLYEDLEREILIKLFS